MPLNIPGEKRAKPFIFKRHKQTQTRAEAPNGRRRQCPSVTSLRAKMKLFFMAAVKFFIRAGTKRGKLHQQRQLISLRDWWELGSRLRLQTTGAANWCTMLKASSWGGGGAVDTYSRCFTPVPFFTTDKMSFSFLSDSEVTQFIFSVSCRSGFINNWSQAVSYFLESDFTSVCSALKC